MKIMTGKGLKAVNNDYQIVYNIVFAVAAAGVMLWVHSVSERNKDRKTEHDQLRHDFNGLQQTVTNMRESIPQRYATINDLNNTTERIERANWESAERQDRTNERMFSTLERIEQKIDNKGHK